MVIATRFRDLPDDQMQHVVDYLDAGKPVIGLRTATHAFNIKGDKKFARYSFNYNKDDCKEGFPAGARRDVGEPPRQAQGAEHARHRGRGREGSPDPPRHQENSIWGPTDVYGIRNLPDNAKPLVMGQVLVGMKPGRQAAGGGEEQPDDARRADAHVQGRADGKEGRVFTTTMGAATDMPAGGHPPDAGERRLLGRRPRGQDPVRGGEGRRRRPVQPTAYGFDDFVKDKSPKDYVAGGGGSAGWGKVSRYRAGRRNGQ